MNLVIKKRLNFHDFSWQEIFKIFQIWTKYAILERISLYISFFETFVSNRSFICNHHQTTECSYHVAYAFQSESTFYSCLNVKELLAQNRSDIWSLSDCNGTRTHNHLARKRTLNHLAKLAINSWMFVYKLCGCGFESHCSHLNYQTIQQ